MRFALSDSEDVLNAYRGTGIHRLIRRIRARSLHAETGLHCESFQVLDY